MNLIIRADANTKIGIGHVMRCLAIGQAWQDKGGDVIFLIATENRRVEARLRSEGFKVISINAKPGTDDDSLETANLAQKSGVKWVVVDGYHFGADYQRIIKDSGIGLLFLDDNGHAEHYFADIVLNQNIYAQRELYKSKEPYTKLMLGTEFALLRREFLKWCNWKREIPDVARKVLITLGGSDPENITLKVIQSLEKIEAERLQVNVVLGGAKPNIESIRSPAQTSRHDIRVGKNVKDIPKRMADADIAFSAGGSTCWELAFMGLPTCVAIIAENHSRNAQTLSEQGVALKIGLSDSRDINKTASVVGDLIKDRKRREEITYMGRPKDDGLGAKRVFKAIFLGYEVLSLR